MIRPRRSCSLYSLQKKVASVRHCLAGRCALEAILAAGHLMVRALAAALKYRASVVILVLGGNVSWR